MVAMADAPSSRRAPLWCSGGHLVAVRPVRSGAALSNRVPATVLLLEVLGAAAALGLLAVYLAIPGRGVLPVVLGAALVAMVLFVTFDLDRPTRGLIQVEPTALIAQRASMELPPAATGPY